MRANDDEVRRQQKIVAAALEECFDNDQDPIGTQVLCSRITLACAYLIALCEVMVRAEEGDEEFARSIVQGSFHIGLEHSRTILADPEVVAKIRAMARKVKSKGAAEQ